MSSLQPVARLQALHSLHEGMEDIEVYCEWWFEEATDLATTLAILMKLPGKLRRAGQGNLESQLTSERCYKEPLSVTTVEHIVQELKEIVSEQFLQSSSMLISGPLCHGTA